MNGAGRLSAQMRKLGSTLILAPLLVVLVAVLGAGGTEERGIAIVCLGDSLTEGFGVAPEHSWPSLIHDRLIGDHPDVRIINAGISGATSASAVACLRWHLRARPEIRILELGANDGLRGVETEATRKNLRDAIELAKENGVKVLLAGMKLPPNYGPEYTERFERIFPELAEEMQVALIPFLLEGVAGDPSLNLPDRIHPNARGYERVAENVLEHLLPML